MRKGVNQAGIEYSAIYAVVFLLLPSTCLSQIRLDSVNKYSYYVQGTSAKVNKIVCAGSGFLTEFDGVYFLVSNYHVFTCRDPSTDKHLYPDTVQSITVSLQNEKNIRERIADSLYINGARNISTYSVGNQYMDIAIWSLEKSKIPSKYKVYPIPLKDVFEFPVFKKGDSIVIAGYPHGNLINGYESTVTYGVITQERYKNGNENHIYFDGTALPGNSGSPVFLKSKDGTLKIIGIVTNGKETNDKGIGVSIAYVAEMIYQLIATKSSNINIRH